MKLHEVKVSAGTCSLVNGPALSKAQIEKLVLDARFLNDIVPNGEAADWPKVMKVMNEWHTLDSWKTGDIHPDIGKGRGDFKYNNHMCTIWIFRDTVGMDFYLISDEHTKSDHGTVPLYSLSPELKDDLNNDLMPVKILDDIMGSAIKRFFRKLDEYLPKDDE